MRAPKCRTCGVEHWGSVCAQAEPAKKSTAARKADVREAKASPLKSPRVGSEKAGTSALPVDTSRVIVAVDPAGADHTAELIGKVKPDGNIEILSLTVRGTPRKRAPKGTFDRKAYQREAARLRRQRKAAEKEAKP